MKSDPKNNGNIDGGEAELAAQAQARRILLAMKYADEVGGHLRTCRQVAEAQEECYGHWPESDHQPALWGLFVACGLTALKNYEEAARKIREALGKGLREMGLSIAIPAADRQSYEWSEWVLSEVERACQEARESARGGDTP